VPGGKALQGGSETNKYGVFISENGVFMWPPCSGVNDLFLPEVRVRVSKILSERGLSQHQIASLLGVTQTMVSRYLRKEPQILLEPLESHAQALALELAESLRRGEGDDVRVKMICSQCMELRSSKAFCPLCSVKDSASCMACVELLTGSRFAENERVVQEINQAVHILNRKDISFLIPEVRSNIAMCLPGAETPLDVAAIPGRLVLLEGELKTLSPPRFGSSRHLSRVLLSAREVDSRIRAVMNLRWSERYRELLERAGYGISYLKREVHGELPGGCAKALRKGTRFLVDPGGFGIEPALYVFGEGAVQVALTVIAIAELIKKKGGE